MSPQVPYSNWRGPVWPVQSGVVIAYALARAGRADLALELAGAVVRLLAADLRLTGHWHENYDSDTGLGLASPGFMSWVRRRGALGGAPLHARCAAAAVEPRGWAGYGSPLLLSPPTPALPALGRCRRPLVSSSAYAVGPPPQTTCAADVVDNVRNGVDPFSLDEEEADHA